MGTISDCCVADEATQLRIDNEGSNMDTRPTQPLIPNRNNPDQRDSNYNPSIYTKQDTSIDTRSNTNIQPQPQQKPKKIVKIQKKKRKNIVNLTTDGIKQSLKKKPSNHKDILRGAEEAGKLSTTRINLRAESIDRINIENKNNKKIRIIVTEPLSPRKKLKDHASFEEDNHPYSLHKYKQKLLTNGYIRQYLNINNKNKNKNIINLIFKFYYFHYADLDSQLSIINNINKKEKSMKLITSFVNENDEDLSQFLETILKSKLAEKMWNKFDSDLKGVVETDKFAQFLILPVILYKSTLHHRQQKNNNNNNNGGNNNNNKNKKPNLDKKAIKSDVEHLAIWIIRNFGEKQRDNSFHFVLSKELYQTKLAEFIDEYIQIHSIQDNGYDDNHDQYIVNQP